MSLGRARFVNGGLAALALAFSTFVWADADSVNTHEESSRHDNVFVAFRPDAITELRLESPVDSQRVLLRRDTSVDDRHAYTLDLSPTQNGSSNSKPGLSLDADPGRVGQLLAALEFATFKRLTDASSVSPGTLGFETPRRELRVEMGALSYRLLLGNDASTSERSVYAQISGRSVEQRIGIVSAQLLEDLDADPRSYRRALLLPHGRLQTQRLSFTRQGTTTELIADHKGFRMEPSGARADRMAVDRIFFALARAKAEAFPDSPPPSAGEVIEITLEPRNGDASTLRLAGPCPNAPGLIHAELSVTEGNADAPLHACIASSVRDSVSEQLSRLDSRTLAPLQADEVDHLVIELDGRRLDLTRRDAGFLLLAPTRQQVDRVTGTAFVERVLGLRGRHQPGARQPSASRVGRVSFIGTSPLENETVRFEVELIRQSRATKGSELLAVRTDDQVTLALDGSAEELLSPLNPWYRSLGIFDVEPSSLVALETRVEGTRPERLRRRDGQWGFETGDRVDTSLIHSLERELTHLQAVRWLSPAVQQTAQPSHASPTVIAIFTFNQDGQKKPQTLRVFERVRGGFRASLDDHPGDFVVSSTLRRLVATSMRDRAPAIIHPDQLTVLGLVYGENVYEFQRGSDGLVEPTGRRSHLGDAVAEVMETLRPLSAVREGAKTAATEPAEFVLRGTETRDGGQPRDFELRFGALDVRDGRQVQLLETDDGQLFYVDRSATLALLDLL